MLMRLLLPSAVWIAQPSSASFVACERQQTKELANQAVAVIGPAAYEYWQLI